MTLGCRCDKCERWDMGELTEIEFRGHSEQALLGLRYHVCEWCEKELVEWFNAD